MKFCRKRGKNRTGKLYFCILCHVPQIHHKRDSSINPILCGGLETLYVASNRVNIMELFLRSNIVLVIPTAIFEERGPGFDEILISRNALNRL